ncbi:aldo/keto reductase [Glacieibacterium sp.]|uniref:aldo/keto reductase n=1 Tax=Glacieibacterium sp. TaxID=2860237 RepID=UPI003AFF7C1F
MTHDQLTRNEMLRLMAGAAATCALSSSVRGAVVPADGQTEGAKVASQMLKRPIPSSGELLPVVGLGTYINFDVAPRSAEYARLPAVLDALFASGGTVIDSSPMYGRAEATTGELLAGTKARKPFLATKVWTSGREAGIQQMTQSMRLLRTERIDLMQIHNLLDWRTHMPTLRAWKAAGRIRYLGITHYSPSAYAEVEAVMRSEKLDFLQINYALDDRAAEARLLPLARERGIAVICNSPFGGGGLLRRLRGTPLPGFARELGATNWAQLALKFLLAEPAVTCVIPGTGNPTYMAENAAAGSGPLPNAQQRRELIKLAG